MPRPAIARSTSAGRRPAGRRRLSRRPHRRGAEINQLRRLDANVKELKGDLQALKSPADKAHKVIGDIRKPLQLPGQVKGRVKRVKAIAQGLDAVATLCSFIPGPIGTGASSLHRALEPLLGKRGRKGILDQAIDALAKVEKAVKPVIKKLDQIERPVVRARDELAGILVHVGRLEMIHDSVADRYGTTPPADVQACLGKLNDGLEVVVKPVRAVRERAAGPLAEAAAALSRLNAALKPLNDAARDVEKALKQLDSKVVRDISSALSKVAAAVKPIRDFMDWVIEKTIGKILKALGIDMTAIDRFFRNIVNSLNPFKELQKRLDKLARDLEAQVKSLPAVAAIAGALDQLQGLQRRLDTELQKVLRGACRAALLPEGVTAAPAPARARALPSSPRGRPRRRRRS